MILPHPESDLSLNLMVLGTEIVRLLKGKDFILVEDMMNSFMQGGKKRTPDMFLNSLTFLYTCGLIERKGYKIKLTPREMEQLGIF
jgi:hypothetical protein